MTAAVDSENPDGSPGPVAGSPQSALDAIRRAITHAARMAPESFGRREQIDAIAGLEAVKNSVEALQAEWARGFARAEAAHQTRAGVVEPEKLERSIGA